MSDNRSPLLVGPTPLWQQAAERIAERIADGGYPEGSRLPAERELCETLGVSRVTVRKALQSLTESGVLTARHGRGWFVASDAPPPEWPNSLESFTETAHRMGLRPASNVLIAAEGMATLDEAEQLGIAPGAPVHHIERVRLLDAVPIAVDRAIVPVSVAPLLLAADWSRASLYGELQAARVRLRAAESTLEARSADEAIAERLGLAVGAPLLIMRQSVSDVEGRVVLVSQISYAGERYRLRTSFIRN